MKSITFFLLAPLVFAASSLGCDEGHDHHHSTESANEILFGIQQTVDDKGVKHVSADYELLGLARQGGWVAEVFRDGDGDGRCYFEDLGHRLAGLRPESGSAKFGGGQLPTSGLLVLANQTEPSKLEGAGWTTGDALTFDASGFAMPTLRPIKMTAPRGELAITAIAPAITDAMPLTTNDSVKVNWTPVTDRGMRVMVALATEEDGKAGSEVRCFGTGPSGSIVIPNEWIGRLFSTTTPGASIKGHVEIATHRQATIEARGDWTVYVVATTVVRTAAFTGH